MGELGSLMIKFFVFLILGTLLSFFIFVYNQPSKHHEEKTVAVEIEKMRGQLEIVNEGDILETKLEGYLEWSYQLLVVLQNKKGEEIVYVPNLKGMPPQIESVSELSRRVIRVHRVGTSEWKERAQQFVKKTIN